VAEPIKRNKKMSLAGTGRMFNLLEIIILSDLQLQTRLHSCRLWGNEWLKGVNRVCALSRD